MVADRGSTPPDAEGIFHKLDPQGYGFERAILLQEFQKGVQVEIESVVVKVQLGESSEAED